MNSELKPKIRFKGFSEDWEQRKYKEIGIPLSGGNLSYDSLNNDGDKKCVLYGDLYTKYECIIQDIKNKTFEVGNSIIRNDILFPQSTTVDAYSLISPACLNEENAETSGVFVIRPYKDINGNFICYYTKGHIEQRKKLSKKAQGLTIVHLYYHSIKDESIMVPNKNEQDKIASVLLNIDNLITLYQHKCDKLVELKKSLMEKMFPQINSVIPEIRLKGFTEDWEQCKLSEVSEKICVGFVGTCEKYYTDSSGIPMYRTGNLNGLKLNQDDLKYVTREFHEQNKKSQLKKGDILIARHGDSGKAVNYELSEDANCLNIVIIRPSLGKCDYHFLTECINSPAISQHVKSLSAGSTQAVINTSEIEKLYVATPTCIEEQNKIAGVMKILDNLITLHQRKHDKLNKIKQSLLNDMFV